MNLIGRKYIYLDLLGCVPLSKHHRQRHRQTWQSLINLLELPVFDGFSINGNTGSAGDTNFVGMMESALRVQRIYSLL